MNKMTQGTGEGVKSLYEAPIEELSEEKKKAIEIYVQWAYTTPEFREKLKEEIKKAFDEGLF